MVPLVIPSILFVVSWIMLASPKIGLVNLLLQHSFGTDHVFVDGGHMRFAVNVDSVQRAGLHLSSRLLGLAKIVRSAHAQ